MLARCTRVYYEKGEFSLFQGVSGHRAGEVRYADGSKYVNRGTGWGSETKSSRLVVEVTLDDETNSRHHKVWIDRFFKDRIGRLTENRRNAIINSMPSFIEVELHCTQGGVEYYKAVAGDLEEWLRRAARFIY